MLSWLNSRVFEGSVSFSERREDTFIVAYVISKDDNAQGNNSLQKSERSYFSSWVLILMFPLGTVTDLPYHLGCWVARGLGQGSKAGISRTPKWGQSWAVL